MKEKICKIDSKGRVRLSKKVISLFSYNDKFLLDFDLNYSIISLHLPHSLVHLW